MVAMAVATAAEMVRVPTKNSAEEVVREVVMMAWAAGETASAAAAGAAATMAQASRLVRH